MIDAPITPEGSSSGKKFWSKPEGRIGMAINIAVIGLIVWFWGSIVPFVLSAAENTLRLAIVSAALCGIGFVLFDPTIRNRAWFIYRATMRALTRGFVNRDPIGIRKTILEKAKAKKEDLDETIGEIRGQRLKLDRTVAANKANYEDSMSRLKIAKRQKEDADPLRKRQGQRVEILESTQISRLDEIMRVQAKHVDRYDYVVDVLTRYSEVCDDTIIDMSRDIALKQQQLDQSKSFQKGMRKVFGILHGSLEDNEMQEMADEALERDYTQKMGEVENILNLTKNDILKADFNDAAAMEKAAGLLDHWKGDNANNMPKGKEDPVSPVRPDSNYF